MTSIAEAPTTATTGGEDHPAWCAMARINFKGKNIACGNHLGKPTNIPATDSDFHVCDAGALFPRAEVAAATVDSTLTVYVGMFAPAPGDDYQWVSVDLAPDDARTFAADLDPVGKGAVAADIAGTELSATVRGIAGGWVSVVTDGGSVRVTVCDHRDQEISIDALLKPDEVGHVVHALVRAADEVEGK